MRITNQMSTNRMLMNINRNARVVDNYYMQLSSGKKIQLPSDNPIIASRALKFRSTVSDTEQYARNASQATSWMKITEEGFANTLSIMENLRSRLVQGATDTLTTADRDHIVTEMRTFAEQIGGEMNVSYAGRYVFSGYRTDKPPIVAKNDEEYNYNITQQFYAGDIQDTSAYVRDDAAQPPEVTVYEISKIDLPYTLDKNGIDNLSAALPAGATLTQKSASVPDLDRYNPGADEVYYIAETGELVLGENVVEALRLDPDAPMDVSYSITKLAEGDLNPVVYFDCVETLALPAGTGTGDVTMMDTSTDPPTPFTNFRVEDGAVVFNPPMSAVPNNLEMRVAGGDPINIRHYTMDDQYLRFEFGANTRIQINNLSKDTYTAVLYSELMNFCDIVGNVQLSDKSALMTTYSNPPYNYTGDQLEKAVEDRLAEETKKFTDYLHESFTAMLGRYEGHSAASVKEYTTLGSRMNRVELTSTRLEQNRVSYTDLMSENENADYLEVIMNLSSMEAIYSASMMAGTRISQMSLADYIR